MQLLIRFLYINGYIELIYSRLLLSCLLLFSLVSCLLFLYIHYIIMYRRELTEDSLYLQKTLTFYMFSEIRSTIQLGILMN